MSKIALLGPKYLVAPLAAAGIDVAACESESHGCKMLGEFLSGGEHAIIFITESLAVEMQKEIEAAEKEGANIVSLPDHRGSIGFFKERLENLIKKATGAAQI